MSSPRLSGEASQESPPGAIEVSGARKHYRVGRQTPAVVDDVSFSVAHGTVHGLLGPNGAGKTTTLKMLLGLVRPTAGRFTFDGVETAAPRARAAVGFLPEQPYFPSQLTATQVLALHGRISGMPPEDRSRRSASLLDRVGLRGKERMVLSKFSRGMLQRLGLAQALLASPRILVLDEPASGLDPVGQRDVRNLILEMRQEGVAVLLSSHQLSEVEAICDEVTILDRGVVAARGRLDDLLNVAGRSAVRAAGEGSGLPETVAAHVEDVAFTGGTWAFSVRDESVREVVDALDDAGWRLVSVAPKRDSLEDYFAKLLTSARPGSGS